MRGVINQFHHLQSGVGTESSMITMSAGNYGRTFATYCQNLGFTGTVIMPESVPDNRRTAIEVCHTDILSRLTQHTQYICITFVQRRPNVFDVGPALYKCYTNVLCLLGL